ncbi:unnamed protein product [Clavelina lepadiformis]|uniref:G-protein coupled receptors family 1 profile domain-containing protein n=1 Tax=Clavelina lepadiformis TaxID=159417 RepID=A0ABP0FRJ8_CLALP
MQFGWIVFSVVTLLFKGVQCAQINKDIRDGTCIKLPCLAEGKINNRSFYYICSLCDMPICSADPFLGSKSNLSLVKSEGSSENLHSTVDGNTMSWRNNLNTTLTNVSMNLFSDVECTGYSSCALSGEATLPPSDCEASSQPVYLSARFHICWIITAAILSANLAVVVRNISILRRKNSLLGNVAKLQAITILNLAAADFLTGINLLGITISTVVNPFDCTDSSTAAWLHSTPCSLLGAASFASTNVSTTALILITSVRMHSILKPYESVGIKKITWIAIGSWIFWTIVAVTPLLKFEVIRSVFIKSVKITNDHKTQKLSHQHILHTLNFLTKAASEACDLNYQDFLVPSNVSWSALISMSRKLNLLSPTDQVYFYDYYVHERICYAEYLSSFHDSSMFFTLAMAGFNALSFLYIASAYVVICRKTTIMPSSICQRNELCCVTEHSNDRPAFQDNRDMENKNAYSKIVIITLSNMFCTLPLSLLSIIFIVQTATDDLCAVNEHEKMIQTWVSVFATAFVPLNSLLNPFIYSAGMWGVLYKKLCRKKQEISKSSTTSSDLHIRVSA